MTDFHNGGRVSTQNKTHKFNIIHGFMDGYEVCRVLAEVCTVEEKVVEFSYLVMFVSLSPCRNSGVVVMCCL